MLNSLEELCITLVIAVNSFTRELNPREESVYIDIHEETVSLYYNSLGRFMLGLKPAQLYVRFSILPLNIHTMYMWVCVCMCVMLCFGILQL